MNVAAEALSRSKIRKLVREFRKAIGCEKMEYFPIVQFIEWILANPESGMDFEIVDPGEMQDTYGTTNTAIMATTMRSSASVKPFLFFFIVPLLHKRTCLLSATVLYMPELVKYNCDS